MKITALFFTGANRLPNAGNPALWFNSAIPNTGLKLSEFERGDGYALRSVTCVVIDDLTFLLLSWDDTAKDGSVAEFISNVTEALPAVGLTRTTTSALVNLADGSAVGNAAEYPVSSVEPAPPSASSPGPRGLPCVVIKKAT